MKRIGTFFAACLALLINFAAGAQNKTDKSLLWQITGKKLTKPSYLFGTIHQICADDYLWTDKMNSSLEKSEKVCMEMDMDDPNLMTEVATGLIDVSGKTLKDYFTPEQYGRLKKYMKDSLGMDIALYAAMKPVALQSIISLGEGKCSNPVSYEEKLMAIAQKSNKEILGLEEAKEQLAVLETIPVDSVIKEVMEVIDRKPTADTEYDAMIAAYEQQDIPKLYKMITTSKELGDGMEAFLDTRNKKWIPRMTEKMNKNAVFFAVGAGHLWGDNGVISLLRKDGYTVEPLK